ncbi:MAG: gliding motility lipoprotein GldH [Chitinophagales bacterium]|nr:gliding motility lipoprotein GldH [Chitinophagales bacterium]
MTKGVLYILLGVFLFSCKSDYDYSKYYHIHKDGWSYSDTLSYNLETGIPVQDFDLFISIRYNENYQFNNLWLKFISDTLIERVDIPLFDKTGKPLGKGSGSIYTKTILWKDLKLDSNGYKTLMVQNMRINPLKDISEVGLLLKKKEKKIK